MSFKLLIVLIGLAVTAIPAAIGFLHFRLPRPNQVLAAFAVQTILFIAVYLWIGTDLLSWNDSWGLGRMLRTLVVGALSAIWFINLVTAFKAWSSKPAQRGEQ